VGMVKRNLPGGVPWSRTCGDGAGYAWQTACPVPASFTPGLSERADAGEIVPHFVALPGVVIPVELAGLLALGDLVRAVAVRLVLRQAALAQPGLLAFDHVAGRLLRRALH